METHNLLRRTAREYRRQGRILEALQAYDDLLGRCPDDPGVWREAGEALLEIGEHAQAQEALRRSLELDAGQGEGHHLRAAALYQLGDVPAAVAHLRRSIELTDSLASWLNLAVMLPGCLEATPREILEVRRTLAARLAARFPPGPGKALPRTGSDRLRVGYLSSFFHAANYMKPVWGAINHHDRGALDLVLFNDGRPELGLPGYRPHPADRVCSTRALDHRALDRLIRESGVDVLVDLNSFSRPDRLALFLDSPAPVVVAWFNAYATTGLPGIRHLIGDHEVMHPGEESDFGEEVVCLPTSYLAFEVLHPAPPVVPPPCLGGEPFTFGSLVSQYKVTPAVLDDWGEILRRCPGSRLLLANTALKSAENRAYVRGQFRERGVPADQLLLLGPAEHQEYLRYYDRVDVALDAFPYNGGTTTMEALWQGVPVLTFSGDRWASRTSQSLIRRTPWGGWVANNRRSWVEQAVQWANSPGTPRVLADLRARMRAELGGSPACDTARLAASLEETYRALAGRADRSRP